MTGRESVALRGLDHGGGPAERHADRNARPEEPPGRTERVAARKGTSEPLLPNLLECDHDQPSEHHAGEESEEPAQQKHSGNHQERRRGRPLVSLPNGEPHRSGKADNDRPHERQADVVDVKVGSLRTPHREDATQLRGGAVR